MFYKEEAIDAESLLIRYRRGLNQFLAEERIFDFCKDKSLKQRFFFVRKKIFDGIPNIHGHDPLEFVRAVNAPGLVSCFYLKNYFIDEFYRFVDDQEARIKRERSEIIRNKKVFRLTVLIYFLGILNHQSVDGNGQTFRLLALSYIREHCPDYKNAFFPIKYDADSSKIGLYT
ncbi:MAG: hypothetical protein GF347_03885, partial [Candidatus Moranbacteria bacterium]|nr:hypothetical protein [Candidatus Moranbacteria bacterium]